MSASKTTWLTDYLVVWAAGAGTVVAALPAARAAKSFKALETSFGRNDVLMRWRHAWAVTADHEKKYLTPETFARRYGDFAPPKLDEFGYMVSSPEQEAVASMILAAIDGRQSSLLWLCDKFDIPSNYPRGAIILRAYESIRGAHEESVKRNPNAGVGYLFEQRRNRLTHAIS